MNNLFRKWSLEQNLIFEWFEFGHGNAVGRARAGCGKTTTIIEGVNRAPEGSILLAAFNNRIAAELSKKITNSHAVAKTLHSVGLAAITSAKTGIQIMPGSDRANALANKVCGNKTPDAVITMVSKLHTKAREMEPFATQADQLFDIAEQFDCVPDEQLQSIGYDTRFVCKKSVEAMTLAADNFMDGIDFSDMIFLPLRNGWLTKAYDLVVIDEAQDMTMAQLEIARRVCYGRIAVIGDDRQAIYGFRGADSSSLDRLKIELEAIEFSLATTYRCAKAIVAEAQKYVPNFMAGEDNPEGSVIEINGRDSLLELVQSGDFILSRTNAPLVATAMTLLRAGKPTRITGRDLGAGLKAIVRRIKATSMPIFIGKLSAWKERELDRAKKLDSESRRKTRTDLICDQYDMLINLSEGAVAVHDIASRIDALFADNLNEQDVIHCSSVHRAKGLEANRVFIFKDTLRSNSEEENNIAYVAITRAKNELIYVTGVK